MVPFGAIGLYDMQPTANLFFPPHIGALTIDDDDEELDLSMN
jgi:hypothetical protein